jgi:hypothetical protein
MEMRTRQGEQMKPTREQILAEPAGGQMDAWVAEFVMGWKWPTNRCPVCGWLYSETRDQGCVPGDCSMRPRPNIVEIQKSRGYGVYSTDIADAWQVVEKMRTSPWKWYEIAHRPIGCMVNFTGNIGDNVYAETAPLAICKAALLATLESESPCVYPTRQE